MAKELPTVGEGEGEGERAERCETCKWWETMYLGHGKRNRSDPLEDDDSPWGYCRRYPPLARGNYDIHDNCESPKTTDDHWCGEWQAKK